MVDLACDVSGVDLQTLACETRIDADFARDVAIDGPTGDLFVLDRGRVRRFDRALGRFVGEVDLPRRWTWPGRKASSVNSRGLTSA